MAVTPGLTNSIWEMTKFLLETFFVSLAPDAFELEEEERERIRTAQNIAMSEFEEQTISQRLHSRRTSILDIEDRKLTRSVSRENFSVDFDYPNSDSFENVLNASREHEALYAYYYMDDENKVRI